MRRSSHFGHLGASEGSRDGSLDHEKAPVWSPQGPRVILLKIGIPRERPEPQEPLWVPYQRSYGIESLGRSPAPLAVPKLGFA